MYQLYIYVSVRACVFKKKTCKLLNWFRSLCCEETTLIVPRCWRTVINWCKRAESSVDCFLCVSVYLIFVVHFCLYCHSVDSMYNCCMNLNEQCARCTSVCVYFIYMAQTVTSGIGQVSAMCDRKFAIYSTHVMLVVIVTLFTKGVSLLSLSLIHAHPHAHTYPHT